MIGPLEIVLNHPVEIDEVIHDKLTVGSFDAIVEFRTNSPEQVIRSLSRVYGVPRRVIRHLEPSDAHRAGDFIDTLLNNAARSPLR